MKPWLKWLLIGGGGLVVVSVLHLAVKDAGTIRVGYADSPNARHQQIKQGLEQWHGFEVAAQTLDSVYMVPRDLTIWFSDCGQANAFYDPDNVLRVLPRGRARSHSHPRLAHNRA